MGKDTFGGKYLGMLNILNVIREWAYCYIPDVLRVSADAAVSSDAVGLGAVCTTRCQCIGSKGTQVILMKSVSVEAVGCEQLAQSRRLAAAPWP